MSTTCDCPQHHEPVIQLRNVEFAYEPGRPILRDVNFEIYECESACIIGPNGGGKTTLLRLLLGLLTPRAGTIRIFGRSPAEARPWIGYMPQYHQLDAAFPVTVLEVALMGRLRPGLFGRYSQADKAAALAALDRLGIADLANRSFSAISGGQRQRTLIARTLAGDPSLLLLDEPTASIDPGAEQAFYQILGELKKKMTVLTVSHDLGFVNRDISRVICVNREVAVHDADKFDAAAADEVYHHKVNMVRHDHSCVCKDCEHRQPAESHTGCDHA